MMLKIREYNVEAKLGISKKTLNLPVVADRKENRAESPYTHSGITSSKIIPEKQLQNENRLRRISPRHQYKESFNVKLPEVEYIRDTIVSDVEPIHKLQTQHIVKVAPIVEVLHLNSKPTEKAQKVQKPEKMHKHDLCHIKTLTFDKDTFPNEPNQERSRTPIKQLAESSHSYTERIHNRAKSRYDEARVNKEYIQKIHSISGPRDFSPNKEKTHNKIFRAWSTKRNKILINPRISYRKLNELAPVNEANDNAECTANVRIPKLPKHGSITPTSSYNRLFKLQSISSCNVKSLSNHSQQLAKSDSKLKTVRNQTPSYLQLKHNYMTNSVNRLRKRSSELCS